MFHLLPKMSAHGTRTYDPVETGTSGGDAKGRYGMYSNTLIGLLAIAMTASVLGGTSSLFEVDGSQQAQEQVVA